MTNDFLAQVTAHPANRAILDRWYALALPDAWLVAGCVFQTVWNLASGRAPGDGIRDHDLFYFDASDPSEAAERAVQARVQAVLADLGVTVDVANQARVHQWYPGHFGRPCAPIPSTEDGIRRFLVLETCVGVRPGAWFAPNGLDAVRAGTLTPNPLTPYPELFERKVASYRARWPWLTVNRPPATA